jgi:hypothetical protein
VHLDGLRGSLGHHDARREAAPPRPVIVLPQRGGGQFGGARVDLHGLQDADHSLVVDLGEPAFPVPELGRDAVGPGKCCEIRIAERHGIPSCGDVVASL